MDQFSVEWLSSRPFRIRFFWPGRTAIGFGEILMPAPDVSDNALLNILHRSAVGLVRREGPDLSARQLAIFLICYLENEAQTVRGLAKKLTISKPAISRGLDRLMEFDLVRRKGDPLDRRSILVQRTPIGHSLLRELRGIMNASAKANPRVSAQSADLMSTRGSNRYTVFLPSRSPLSS
jgi:DNA-binding MarR family transcriptional regulator